jgi:hypothetical protein
VVQAQQVLALWLALTSRCLVRGQTKPLTQLAVVDLVMCLAQDLALTTLLLGLTVQLAKSFKTLAL